MSEQITKEMTIADILSNFPQKSQKLAQALTNAGLQCVGCNAATWETLEAGVLGHGMPEQTLNNLLVKLNTILKEEVNLDTISMTERAAQKFVQIAKEEGQPGAALRFGDMAGGCSGFEYILDFAEKAETDDAIFDSHGVQIFVQKGATLSRLLGSEIDYVDGLHGSGFKVSNPNAKSSCGCGKSQGY